MALQALIGVLGGFGDWGAGARMAGRDRIGRSGDCHRRDAAEVAVVGLRRGGCRLVHHGLDRGVGDDGLRGGHESIGDGAEDNGRGREPYDLEAGDSQGLGLVFCRAGDDAAAVVPEDAQGGCGLEAVVAGDRGAGAGGDHVSARIRRRIENPEGGAGRLDPGEGRDDEGGKRPVGVGPGGVDGQGELIQGPGNVDVGQDGRLRAGDAPRGLSRLEKGG